MHHSSPRCYVQQQVPLGILATTPPKAVLCTPVFITWTVPGYAGDWVGYQSVAQQHYDRRRFAHATSLTDLSETERFLEPNWSFKRVLMAPNSDRPIHYSSTDVACIRQKPSIRVSVIIDGRLVIYTNRRWKQW